MALGKRIRQFRESRGLTLEQLSILSEVDIGTISALENRDSKRSNYAPAIAKALGISLDDLYEAPVRAGGVRHMVKEPQAAYGAWPFPDVKPAEWQRLTDAERAEVQGFVKAMVARHKRRAA